MKRLWALLLALCLTLALAAPALAMETEEPVTSGTCGKDITWNFDTETGTLTLTGTGNTKTYQSDGVLSRQAPWAHLREQITTIVVGEGITSLYPGPFCHCTSLTSVSLPSTLVNISDDAFYGCTSLTEIELPANLKDIHSHVFEGCTSLAKCTLPEGLTSLGSGVFKDCALTEITIPEGITHLGGGVFANCSALETVHLPDTMEVIDGGFSWCTSLKTLDLPDGLTRIGAGAFNHSGLTEIVIPEGVTVLEDDTFAYCADLVHVTLPDSITKIGERCFINCISLEGLDMPENLTSIGLYALRWSQAERFDLPCGLESIGAYAFDRSPRLREVVIPCSVTEIGEKIFNDCTNEVRILCWEGTYAHRYAMANGIPYELMTTPCCGLPFRDVPKGVFYEEPVRWALEEGIVNGISDDLFGSTQATNRAAAVTMLWRYAGCPEPETAVNPFTDVPAGSFYEKAVLWAQERGITNGISDTEFGPTLSCNRAQVVTFLYRLRGAQAPEGTANPFTDVPAGSWYEAPVLWALKNGITTGATNTTFDPNGSCMRAHFVTFLYRMEQMDP